LLPSNHRLFYTSPHRLLWDVIERVKSVVGIQLTSVGVRFCRCCVEICTDDGVFLVNKTTCMLQVIVSQIIETIIKKTI